MATIMARRNMHIEWRNKRGIGTARSWSIWALAAFTLGVMARPALADGLGYDGLPPQELCGLCHSLNGISATAKFPKLAGQKAVYIEKQLRDFLSQSRTNDGGQMANIVTEIKPEQFSDVAKYYSQLPPPPPDTEATAGLSEADIRTAASIFENGRPDAALPACKTCHEAASAPGLVVPLLTSQHARYLEKQLMDFRAGLRSNDPAKTMQKIARKLSDADIRSLAAFLAARARNRG